MNRNMDGCSHGWMGGLIDMLMDARVDGWMLGWID